MSVSGRGERARDADFLLGRYNIIMFACTYLLYAGPLLFAVRGYVSVVADKNICERRLEDEVSQNVKL